MKILKRVFQELDFFLLDFWDRLAKSLSNKNWSKLFHLPFNRSQSPLAGLSKNAIAKRCCEAQIASLHFGKWKAVSTVQESQSSFRPDDALNSVPVFPCSHLKQESIASIQKSNG